LGQALAARVPSLFFIDDIHWADSASLDLLHYAARRWAETHSPVLVLLTLRSEAGQSFAQWLADLNRALPGQRLALDSLTADHTLQLIQTLAGLESTTPALRAFSEWLFTETDGQPFFMMETLKALVERGVLATLPDQAGEWTVDFNSVEDRRALAGLLPSGVRDVIRARLVRLSPAAADLLAAASVVGQTAHFEALCQVAGVGEGEGLRALDELLAGRLLLESATASTAPKYLFAHDKIREAVYTEAGEARRRVFHRRALTALEAEAAPPATLARHALAGGLDERGFHLSLAAGDEALRVFAVRDAIAHYTRAEKLMAVQAQLGDWESRFHLQRQLGRAYELMADYPNARSVYESMLTLARSVPAPKAECVALNRLATLTAHELHKPTALPTAITLLEQARQIAVASGDTVGLAETEWNLAQSFFYSWEVRHSIAHGEQALQLARELSESASAQNEAATRELVGRCLNVLAYPKLIAGRFAETETHAIEAYAIYAELGNRAMETDSLCLASEARVRTGRLEAGIATARTARAISLEIDNLWGQANTAYHLAFALLEHGDYGEALAISQTGVAAAKAAGYSPQRIFNLLTLGNIQRALFSLPEACTAHLEALAINATLPPRPVSEPIFSELCADYALTEKWVEAHAYARQALAARDYEVLVNAMNRWSETEALIRGGDIELAEEDLRRYGEHVGDNLRRRVDYLRALAVLAQARGETEQAVAHLREAATIAEQIGLPGELWPIYAALGETDRAAEIVKALAAKIDDAQLRETFLSAKLVRLLGGPR